MRMSASTSGRAWKLSLPLCLPSPKRPSPDDGVPRVSQNTTVESVFRLSLIKEQTIPYAHADKVLTPDDVHDLIREYLQGADREHFIAVFLDTQSKVIGINTVSVGTLTESLVQAREVFKGA